MTSRSSSFARPSSSRFKPAPLQVLQHQDSSAGSPASPGLLSTGRVSATAAASGRGSWAHSATAAARLARQASSRSAAAQTGDSVAATRSRPYEQDFPAAESGQTQQQGLEQDLATANAQLASALATARQVLSELVLGQEPAAAAATALQAELCSLGLEEALTEVVYQVQEKLAQAAAVAEAAEAAAAAAAASVEQPRRLPIVASSRASSMRVNSPRVSGQLLAAYAFGGELLVVTWCDRRSTAAGQQHASWGPRLGLVLCQYLNPP